MNDLDNYKCVIADHNLIEKKWDIEIAKHNNSEKWKKFKEMSFLNEKTRIVYMGILNGRIITEATAIIDEDDNDLQNKDEVIGNKIAYLLGFRTEKEYEGKKYFSKLYKFMEKDLISRGFETLALGVEPCEVRNMQIYFGWGYNHYIKTSYEVYPAEENKEPEQIAVNYYSKNIKQPIHMLNEYKKLSLIEQNQYDGEDLENLSLIMTLQDIGFDNFEEECYMNLFLKGNSTKAERMKMLNKKRSSTLSEIHFKEKQLDKLDYLRYEMRKK